MKPYALDVELDVAMERKWFINEDAETVFGDVHAPSSGDAGCAPLVLPGNEDASVEGMPAAPT